MDTPSKPLAIISGGTGYIGSALVAQFVAAGWEAATLSRHPGPGTYECDVTDEQAVCSAVATIVEKHGTVAACIHAAAAPLERVPLLSISTASFDASMDTAARAAFLLAKEVLPHMQKNATFIGLTTQAIEQGIVQSSGAYVPGKYALRGLLRVLASETKQGGIRVYAVAPGFLPGGLNSDLPVEVRNFLAGKSGTDADAPKALGELVLRLCVGEVEIPSGSSVSFPSLAVSPL